MLMLLPVILLALSFQEPLPIGPYDGLNADVFPHAADVHAAAVPAGSKILITLDAAGTISGWELKTGRRLYSRPALPPSELPQRMTCSRDGRWVALSARKLPATSVRVYSVADGDEVHLFDKCSFVAFSPDGTVLAGTQEKRLRRWSMKSGAELPELPKADEELGCLTFSQGGNLIAAALQGTGTTMVWNQEKRTSTLNERRNGSEATALAFGPDWTLVTGTAWGVDGYRALRELPDLPGGPPLFFTPDFQRLICGYRNKQLSILDVKTQRLLKEYRLSTTSPEFLEVSDDGELLLRISGAAVKAEHIVLPEDKPERFPAVACLALIPGGKAVFGDHRGSVATWDVAGRKLLSRFSIPELPVHSLSADGRRALVIGEEPRIWDVGAGRELAKIDALPGSKVAALSPDGDSLAVGQVDGVVVLWDIGAGRERVRIPTGVAVSSLVWSADGKSVAWGDASGGIGMAGSKAGEGRVQRTTRGEAILSMAFSPDGKTLVTGDRKGDLRLWSEDLGREPDLIRSRHGAIAFLCCSPDGRWVATAAGRRITLDSMNGREKSLEFEGFRDGIASIGFSPDGDTLLSGEWDGSVMLWKVPPKQ